MSDATPAPDADPVAGVRQRTRLQRSIRQMLLGVFLIDAGVLFVASVFAWFLQGSIDQWWDEAPYPYHWSPFLGPGLIVLWLAMLVLLGAYRTRNYGSGFEEFRAIGLASTVALAVACMVGFLSANQLTRGYPLLFFVFATPAIMLARYVDRKTLHMARSEERLVNRVIAVGSPAAVAEVAAVIDRAPWMGYRIVGMCVPNRDAAGIDIPVLGGIDDVPEVAVQEAADTVLVAGGSYSSASDLRRMGWNLQGLGLSMLVVPALTDIAGPRVHMRHMAGLPFVEVDEPQSDRAGGWAKRAFDLVVTSLLLVLVSPVFALVALLVWIQDRGPVFYRQQRIGLDGHAFEMIKFRSMRVDAEEVRPDLADDNEHDGVLFKIRDDPRVTRVGRFLRRYSVDELPQLVNVFRGEMSLVGPRPPLPKEVEQYERDVHRRLMVRPGMTGLWQVSGRSDLSWSESVRLDLYYVDNWSMIIDVVIILKTVKAVVSSAGAY